MGDKTDRRVKYTRMILGQSLLELMRDRPIGRITVKEICEKADINRGTFYAHYSDPYDLLSSVENRLHDEIMLSVDRLQPDNVAALLTEIFRAIVENGELCQVLFSEYGDKDFIARVLYIAHDKCVEEWTKHLPGLEPEKLDLLYSFYAYGSIAIIQKWVQDGMTQSPSELARFIEKVSSSGLRAIREDA